MATWELNAYLNIQSVAGLQYTSARRALSLFVVLVASTVTGVRIESTSSVTAMDVVLSLVGMHGSMAWPNSGLIRSVRLGISLHVRVAPVRERLIRVYQVWILTAELPVWPLEPSILGVHDQCWLNGAIEKLQLSTHNHIKTTLSRLILSSSFTPIAARE